MSWEVEGCASARLLLAPSLLPRLCRDTHKQKKKTRATYAKWGTTGHARGTRERSPRGLARSQAAAAHAPARSPSGADMRGACTCRLTQSAGGRAQTPDFIPVTMPRSIPRSQSVVASRSSRHVQASVRARAPSRFERRPWEGHSNAGAPASSVNDSVMVEPAIC
jgi:hypothetical protein